MGVQIKVTGLAELQKKFKQLPQAVEDEVDAELAAAANEFVNRAVADAPVDQGRLKNLISSSRVGRLHYEVVSGAEYSAYVEFGTRSRVQVPADLQAYAAQFKGGGKGDAKKMIYAWCKRVGIPEKAWYPVFVKIMTQGIKAQPFFFKQRLPVEKAMRQNIDAAIKRVTSK